LPPQPWVARYASLPRADKPTTYISCRESPTVRELKLQSPVVEFPFREQNVFQQAAQDSDEYIAILGCGGNALQAKTASISVWNRVV